jgi:hypothetical protein
MSFRSLFAIFFACFFLHAQASLFAIIRIPQPTTGNLTYQELQCTDLDRERISALVHFFAENNYMVLYWKTDYIRGLGAQINGVHPLKFLSLAVHELKAPMRQIFDDPLKGDAFLKDQDGLVFKLEREARKGPLVQYLNDFAEDVGIAPEELTGFFANSDWAGLVVYVLYK